MLLLHQQRQQNSRSTGAEQDVEGEAEAEGDAVCATQTHGEAEGLWQDWRVVCVSGMLGTRLLSLSVARSMVSSTRLCRVDRGEGKAGEQAAAAT